MYTKKQRGVRIGLLLTLSVMMGGCAMQQRRVDVIEPTGADDAIDNRFGLTADAQDPSERDKELGYGRWKAKPEPKGTSNPTDPDRRGTWTGSP